MSRQFLAAAWLAVCAPSALAGGDACNPVMPGHVPDLDQVRAPTMSGSVVGLPGDGYGYCAPTTTVGVFLYLANNGYPSLEPGPGSYLGGAAIYNAFTQHILEMGQDMLTDQTTGTTFSNMHSAISMRIAEAGLTGSIIPASASITSDGAPSLDDLRAYVALGWPAIAAFGWYQPTLVGGATHYTRTAGHVAIVRSVQNACGGPGLRTLSLRDPATLTTYPYTQLPPATDTYPVFTSANTLYIGGSTYSGQVEFILGYSFDDSFAFLDGVWVFIPVFGLTPCCDGLSIGVTSPLPGGGSSFRSIALPPGRAIVDGAMSARRHRFLAVVDRTTASSPRTLWEADLSTGAAVPVATPVPPALVCTGRDPGQRYVLGENGAIYGTVGATSPVASVPAPVSAMCYDAERNHVVCLSSAARRVFRFHGDSLAPISNQSLPSTVLLGDEPRIAICPVGAYLWLAGGRTGSGADRLHALTGSGPTLTLATTITHPVMTQTVGVDADDRGHVFTSVNGTILEFAPPPTPTGAWSRVAASRWSTMAVAGPWFQIARSVNNLTRGIHDQAAFSRFEIPDTFAPNPVPDCPPDINGSGTLTVQDLFDFLALYFAADLHADFNGSGDLSVQDLFDYLAAYFAGC